MSKLTEADRHLLAQIRRGDSDGWSQLVDRYQGRLLAFARGQLGHTADGEDAVQDTFLNFLKGLANYREQASLETYLYGILRRRIVDQFRGRRVNVCSLQDALGGSGAGPDRGTTLQSAEPTASWYARRNEHDQALQEKLWAALSDLVERYKHARNFRNLQVIEMVFYAQMRNKDIAEHLGMNEKQVALLKHRFLSRLSQQIQQVQHERATGQPSLIQSTAGDSFPYDDLLAQVWEQHRPSCPKRSTVGGYLLGTLDQPWHAYVDFHIKHLGCRFCQANLDDLEQQNDEAQPALLRDRIMQSTVGFLSAPSSQ